MNKNQFLNTREYEEQTHIQYMYVTANECPKLLHDMQAEPLRVQEYQYSWFFSRKIHPLRHFKLISFSPYVLHA
jgi:hypothetical protein